MVDEAAPIDEQASTSRTETQAETQAIQGWYTPNPASTIVPVELVLHTGFHMFKAKLPPRGASSQQRQAVGVGAVVLSGADRDATMEELASVGVRASRV